MLRLRARGLSAMLLSFVSNVSSLPAPSAAGYSSPANVEWSIFLLVSFDFFFRSLSISSLYVHDTDVFRVFCRPAIFVSTDGVASGVAPGGFSQCRCWGLDEGDVAALCRSHSLVFIYRVCFTVQAVPTEYPFAGFALEFGQQQQCQETIVSPRCDQACIFYRVIIAIRVDDFFPNRTGRCSRYKVSSCGQYLVGYPEWLLFLQLVLQILVKFIIKVVPGCSNIDQHCQGFHSKSGCVSISLPSFGWLRSSLKLC